MQILSNIIYIIFNYLSSFKYVSRGTRVVNTIRVKWICYINFVYEFFRTIQFASFLIGYLRFRTNPRVNHFVEGKVKCRSKSEKIISSSKCYSKVDSKLKEQVCHNSHTGYKKSTVPQPHVNGRMIIKAFSGKANFIQPALRGDVRFLDSFKFEIPPVNQNTGSQMHKDRFKQIAKISNGKTHHKTQNHTLIAVEKRATCRKIFSHWLSYSGHNLHYFIHYFTTYNPKKLQFFKYLQGLTIPSFSPSRRCA